ncbi:hypothetical protein B566_EDAN016535 [Ephemera danica]|nr:hypothetical protein B566_EDAN016535 [Ephemera danica]
MLRYICVLFCFVSFGLLLADGAPADGTADLNLEEVVVPDYYNYGGNAGGGGKRKCNGKRNRGSGEDAGDVDYLEGSLANQRRINNRGGNNDRTISRLDNGKIRVGANNRRAQIAGVTAAKIQQDPSLERDTAKADGTLTLPDGTLKDGTLQQSASPDGTLKDGTLKLKPDGTLKDGTITV